MHDTTKRAAPADAAPATKGGDKLRRLSEMGRHPDFARLSTGAQLLLERIGKDGDAVTFGPRGATIHWRFKRRTIAKYLGTSERTVSRCIKELTCAGWIVCKSTGRCLEVSLALDGPGRAEGVESIEASPASLPRQVEHRRVAKGGKAIYQRSSASAISQNTVRRCAASPSVWTEEEDSIRSRWEARTERRLSYSEANDEYADFARRALAERGVSEPMIARMLASHGGGGLMMVHLCDKTDELVADGMDEDSQAGRIVNAWKSGEYDSNPNDRDPDAFLRRVADSFLSKDEVAERKTHESNLLAERRELIEANYRDGGDLKAELSAMTEADRVHAMRLIRTYPVPMSDDLLEGYLCAYDGKAVPCRGWQWFALSYGRGAVQTFQKMQACPVEWMLADRLQPWAIQHGGKAPPKASHTADVGTGPHATTEQHLLATKEA